MRLTEQQITMIEKYLEKDRIFYDDIRMEMTDHIATTLEEQLQDGDDFDAALKEYMNSHLKVKLLTAAREQEKVRDKQNRQLVLKQFVSLRGILSFALITGMGVIASLIDVWAFRLVESVLLIMMVTMFFGQKRLSRRYPLYERILSISQFYYLLPFLLLTQLHRFIDETPFIYVCNLVATGFALTGFYLTYVYSRQLQNKRHA